MTIEINRIELIMSVHATESMKKNDQVLTNIISEELLKKNKIITEEFEGGYGNPIIIKKVELARKKDIEEFIAFFSQRLTEESKKKLFSEFEERFDENKNRFYIRIEKEEAYKG
ncbi:MAG: RNA-binding domain-containing protein, partial [Candidatus Heimdallarchaeaceae archaeon]